MVRVPEGSLASRYIRHQLSRGGTLPGAVYQLQGLVTGAAGTVREDGLQRGTTGSVGCVVRIPTRNRLLRLSLTRQQLRRTAPSKLGRACLELASMYLFLSRLLQTFD